MRVDAFLNSPAGHWDGCDDPDESVHHRLARDGLRWYNVVRHSPGARHLPSAWHLEFSGVLLCDIIECEPSELFFAGVPAYVREPFRRP